MGNYPNPRDYELSDGDEYDVESYWADHDEHALLTRKYHITVPVGQSRDIAKAQPITNTISLMFTDIKGPFKVPGLGGEIYAQSFIEADTKFLRRFYFSYRSEALANLKKLLEVALASESTKLLAYCSDGAPELISRGCVKMLADHGSKILWSPPYAPTSNAVVERNHRTTFESAHAMLIDSGLPSVFWVFAAEYSTQIFNCLPTTTKSGYMSPVQAKYGLVPSVAHFRRFGCLCYCHIPAETRAKGFIEKSYKSYFLGIDMPTQAFKVWVIDKNMVQVSSNVIFDEFSKTSLPDQAVVPVDPNPRDIRNFTYLIGMVYRDNENDLLYVTTRIVVTRGFIVAYRSPYVKENVVGQEESRPIHVADAE